MGLVIHNLIGLTAGFVYALLVMHGDAARARGVRNGLETGLVAGAVTIFVGCIPMAVRLGESIPGVLAFVALPLLAWGSVVGVVVGYWMGSPESETSLASVGRLPEVGVA